MVQKVKNNHMYITKRHLRDRRALHVRNKNPDPGPNALYTRVQVTRYKDRNI